MSYGQDMERFMLLGGQTVNACNLEQAGRYAHHCEEEAKETREAFDAGDLVKTLDGAVDMIFVALGLIHSLGVDPDAAWGVVLRANMSKVDGTLGPVVRRADGQVGKPEGWKPPEPVLEKLLNINRHPIHEHIEDMNSFL